MEMYQVHNSNMGDADREFLDILACCQEYSISRQVKTRNSVCRRIVHVPCVFDRTPLVTVKKTAWKQALREWKWFMSGSNKIADLHSSVWDWWKPWVNEKGKVPFNYSKQFRRFHGYREDEASYDDDGVEHCDQIQYLIDSITNHPYSRRAVITTWNTAEMIRAMKDPKGITNCHGTVIQAFVDPDNNKLSLVTYQRSVDVCCGLPHNWIQYWAFLMWLAHRSNRAVGNLHWIGGDVHVYADHTPHVDAIRRIPHDSIKINPELVYVPSSLKFRADDFSLDGEYVSLYKEKIPMIV